MQKDLSYNAMMVTLILEMDAALIVQYKLAGLA
jgi:hypothetical protein